MSCKSNCACLSEKLAEQVETVATQEFRDYVRGYCHVIESDLVAENRQGITWAKYPALAFIDYMTAELETVRRLATLQGAISDEWEEDLGLAIRELAGTAVLSLMALAGDLKDPSICLLYTSDAADE